MHQLRLRGDLTATPGKKEGWILSGQDTLLSLPDQRAGEVLKYLDGRFTAEELALAVPSSCIGFAKSLVADLQRRGLAGPYPSPTPTTRADLYTELAGGNWEQGQKATTQPTAVHTHVAEHHHSVTAALTLAGLEAVTWTKDVDVDVCVLVCDDYLSPATQEIVRAVLKSGALCLPVQPSGLRVAVGPLLGPPTSGLSCWVCTTTRLEANAADHPGGERPTRHTAQSTAMLEMACALAAEHVLRQRLGLGTALGGDMWVFDPHTLTSRRHAVVADPTCPECGDPQALRQRLSHAPTLTSQLKVDAGSTAGGRAAPPEDTFRRYEHLISPVTGLVPGVHTDQRLPAGLYACLSGSNAGSTESHSFRSALRWDCSGKGKTLIQAQTGALCEALERRSTIFRGYESVTKATVTDAGPLAIHPDDLQHFAPFQYEQRHTWNGEHSPFQHVPEPVTDDDVLSWSQCWSLLDGSARLVPTGLAYLRGPDTRILAASSNGAAAGSTLEDAALQAMLEIIERDAVALWWYNRATRPPIEPAHLRDPWFGVVRQAYADMGRDMWLLDLTCDTATPVAAAVSVRRHPHEPEAIFGFGAGLTFEAAAARAACEMNQFMAGIRGAQQADIESDPDLQRWITQKGTPDLDYLLPDHTQSTAGVEAVTSSDVLTDLHLVRDRLLHVGLTPYIIDQTRSDTQIPVARIIVPGARHFWARFGPGRLYDVPARLGWVPQPTRPEQLNPYPVFM